MPRGWLVSLMLSVGVLTSAAAARVQRGSAMAAAAAEAEAASDPCFSYGRFECCVRP